jgi:uncharacterized surface protein with fasciclin (FAS1) repeats
MHRSILLSAIASMALAADLLTFPDLLKSTPTLSNSSKILQTFPNYVDLYSSADNFTCFVPNDEAFAGAPGILDSSDQYLPEAVLLYCVYGTYKAEDLSSNGSFLHTFLNTTDFPADTVIQEGGAVLEYRQEGNQTFVISGLNAAGISAEQQNPEPTFPNIRPGPRQMSAIVDADIPFQGGLLHTIDALVTPPLSSLSKLAEYVDLEAVTAANSTGELDSYSELPEFTIFVPNNTSYETYAASAIPKLSAGQIQNITNYNFLDGVIAYADHFTPEGNAYRTRSGWTVTLTRKPNGALYVDEVEVDVDDYLLPNGVMHTLKG